MTHIDLQNMMNIYLLELDDEEKLPFVAATEQEIAQVELASFMRWYSYEEHKRALRVSKEVAKEFEVLLRPLE